MHHIAVGGRWLVICELGVALLVEEASDVEASSPSARLADDREPWVREHRPRSPSPFDGFVSKFQIRDHGLIGQLVNDIVGFKRAATGQSNAKGCRTRSYAPARATGKLKALAGECESSCAKCGDWTCR